MATIQKRKNSYNIAVSNGYDIYGKQIRETTTFTPDPKLTPKQQEKSLDLFVSKFEDKVKSGKYLKGEKITLENYAEQWLKEYGLQQLVEITYYDYSDHLARHILPALGHFKLTEITPLRLQSFFNNLTENGVRSDGKEGGLGTATIKKCKAVISSMFSTAILWQLVDFNPCKSTRTPKTKKETSEDDNIKYFTPDQAEIFITALESKYVVGYKNKERTNRDGKQYVVRGYEETKEIAYQLKVFIYMSLFSGCRKGELVALTWDDIDFKSNSIRIIKSSSYRNKKIITKTTKSDRGRDIVLPESIMKMIKQHKIEQNKYRLSIGDKWIDNNYLFTQSSGKQINPSTPYHAFKKVLNRHNETITDEFLKLPNISLHGLRHTSATLLIADNLDIQTVSTRLGHAKTSTTTDIYSHALKKKDLEASNSFESFLNKKSDKQQINNNI